MAWMPVAEAAARLGVSERTIWRRIKSETIPSRSDHGRTLVDLDEQAALAEGASGFALRADLGGRDTDDEGLSALVAELAQFRATGEHEVKRARRSARAALALVAVLAGALGLGVWYHGRTVERLRLEGAQALGEQARLHGEALSAAAATRAREATAVEARSAELALARQSLADQRAGVDALAASNNALQCLVDERLDELSTGLAQWSIAGSGSGAERDQLTKTVEELRATLHQKDVALLVTQQQSDRIIATLRRHAARSAGLAEGLQIHVGWQQQAIARAQAELNELRAVLAGSPGQENVLNELALRRQLRDSVLQGPFATDAIAANRAVTMASPGEHILHTFSRLRHWFAQWSSSGSANGPDGPDGTIARVD